MYVIVGFNRVQIEAKKINFQYVNFKKQIPNSNRTINRNLEFNALDFYIDILLQSFKICNLKSSIPLHHIRVKRYSTMFLNQ